MNLAEKILTRLNIRAGEGQLVALILAYSFLVGVARIVTRSVSMSLFLVQFDAQQLPWIYIGISLIVTFLSYIYLKLGQRYPLSRLLLITLAFLIAVSFALWLGVSLSSANWLIFGLPIWYEVMWTLTSLAFWNLAGRLFNVRQGKRLFGLVSSGEPVAILLVGLLVPWLVSLMGTTNLLLVAALSITGIWAVQLTINRRFPKPLNLAVKQNSAQPPESTVSLFKNNYIRLICMLFAVMIVGYFFIDNIFYSQAQLQFAGEDALTAFIGIFFGASGLMGLLAKAFAVGPGINKYGVRTAILVEPVVLTVVAIAVLATGLLPAGLVILFWLTAGLKFTNHLLFLNLDLTLVNIFYQPLPALRRTQVQTLVEGIVYPLAIGVAGVSLLVLNTVLGLGFLQIVVILLAILIGWGVIALFTSRKYPNVLRQALVKRKLHGTPLSFTDEASRAVLQQALRNPHPGVALYALNTLTENEPDLLNDTVPLLLAHPTPEVKIEALRRIEQSGLVATLDAVVNLVNSKAGPAVRASALQTLAAIGPTEAIEKIYPYLENPNVELQRAAIVGLLRYSSMEVAIMAEGQLLKLALDENPVERIRAAEIIGQVKSTNLRQLLQQLLEDKNANVRKQALAAAGQAGFLQLWPGVVTAATRPESANVASTALIAGGQPVVSIIRDELTRDALDRRAATRLVKVLGRIGGSEAEIFLRNWMSHPDDRIRTCVLSALGRCNYQTNNHAEIHRQIELEVQAAGQTVATLVDLGKSSTPTLLNDIFLEQLARSKARIFWLLSFTFHSATILRARDNLLLPSVEKQAYALEVLDDLLPTALRRLVFPLIQPLSPEQRLQRLNPSFHQTELGYQGRLQALLTQAKDCGDGWLCICILFAIGIRPQSNPEMIETILELARKSDQDFLVRDAAISTLLRLDAKAVEYAATRSSPQYAPVVELLNSAGNGDYAVFTIVERVLMLKTVDLFKDTPGETLAQIAALLEEVELPPDKTVIHKGDRGDCMYIVVNGRLKAHDGNHIFNTLAEGDVFGEMALLDPEPRVASITTLEESHLLRLNQEPFYELMEDHSEVARGIIHVLSAHLRNRVQDVARLKAKLNALDA